MCRWLRVAPRQLDGTTPAEWAALRELLDEYVAAVEAAQGG
jgi:hypothetical protein